jgi:hypothetical protein
LDLSRIRLATHLANALLIHDANACAVTAQNASGEIDTSFFRGREFRNGALQFDATTVAEEALFQNPGATGRAGSPADWLSTLGTFHDRKLLGDWIVGV